VLEILRAIAAPKPRAIKVSPETRILEYWRSQEPLPLKKVRIPDAAILSTLTIGLGDTMMLTDIPRAARQQSKSIATFSISQHFRPLMAFNPFWKEPGQPDQAILVNAPSLVRFHECGNGHYLQRLRRAFGLEVDDAPRGCIHWEGQRHKDRVLLHFDPGQHVNWQRKTIHPRARMLYPETRSELEKFIAGNHGLDFISVGNAPDGRPIHGSRHLPTRTIADLVNLVGSASWFIGIMSGPMHLATAMSLKCVVIVNFPAPWEWFLPTLRVTDQLEFEWAYPQNVHLHQEGEGPLCRKATAGNLRAAFGGDVWPNWKTDHCALINEKL
jgi:hypothetical protein